MEKTKKDYFLGLDIGTDSVGYAVTDEKYDLLKFKGEPMWGAHLFEEAKLNDERRAFRVARRRLDRRQQRIRLLQELFAKEIVKVDPHFYIRIKESALYPKDTTYGASLFCDKELTDAVYNERYPTIHHLIMDLINDPSSHDVRLVYLALAWLVAHRGHFLNEVSKENISEILKIENVYEDLMSYFPDEKPWGDVDLAEFGNILKKKVGVTTKRKELSLLLYGTPKVKKAPADDPFPYDRDSIVNMLCGGKVAPKDLFMNEEYSDIDSFNLSKSDDELAAPLTALGDDAELITRLKALYDWGILSNALPDGKYISKTKIAVYEEHKADLEALKFLIRKYVGKDGYNEMFRLNSNKVGVNYEAYAKGNCARQEDFCKSVKSLLKGVTPEPEDAEKFDRVMTKAENLTLCPKQVNSDNRVLPYQIYWIELKAILDNASKYLDFLTVSDEDGLTVCDKIMSIFEFRVPYYVGPLNRNAKNSWFERKAEGRITPWNFDKMVDHEASEQAFIDRMTNTCTYLPSEDVLPKMSLCYERFQMLNEINLITVCGRRIPVEVKQSIYNDLCMNKKRLTKKAIGEYLCNSNVCTREDLETLSGIDINIKSSLSSHMAFRSLISRGVLTYDDAERIIKQRTYTESKARFIRWIEREYPSLSDEDKRYISSLKFKDFGRLSRKLLDGIYGTERDGGAGEAKTVLERMWNENVTLMELLSDRYTYSEAIESLNAEYFGENSISLDERLNEMYVSNSVKRPIIRTFDIIDDVVKATGNAPSKIFIEMARGGNENEKGKRKNSRYKQILDLYATCDCEDVRELSRELENMGDAAETKLQSDRLFLYYMQLGKCMYTETPIELSQLSSKLYDIDHIYPQSKVADDSILNNKVLVLSTANADKGNKYPIASEIRHSRYGFWKGLLDKKLITEEKFKRLTRNTPFTDDEEWGFINRQLVETRQSTKVIATLLGEKYPDTRIVYVKARLASDFRHEFDLFKSRKVNDLHHAKDAYLNVVVGNVYNEKFTRQWFLKDHSDYSVNIRPLFTHPVTLTDGRTVWNGKCDLEKVIKAVRNKNAIRLTRYSFCRRGGLFDQQPVAAKEGLVPLKAGLPTEKYGGYNKPVASFFVAVKYTVAKKTDLMIMPVELMFAGKVLSDMEYAKDYAKRTISSIIGKEVLNVEFPIGMRQIKIGTVFEFDGVYRAYITGKANGGKIIGISTYIPIIVGYRWEKYIKHLEKLSEKKKEHPGHIYSKEHDEVSPEENLELYDILTTKMQNAVYSKRPANPKDILIKGRNKFEELDIFDQTKVLLNIISTFGKLNGCDLSQIGGSSKSGVATLSSTVSNWKKSYTDVRIVDSTASGLYSSKSENLLELI